MSAAIPQTIAICLLVTLLLTGCATTKVSQQVTAGDAQAERAEAILKEIDHYWHHQNEDVPPGSFTRVIDGYRRYIALAPDDVDAYTTAAWLLWSRWVTGGKKTRRDLDEAISLLADGCRLNEGDGEMNYQSAFVMLPVAREHDPSVYRPIAGWLDVAIECNLEPGLQKRAHLMHIEARTALRDPKQLARAKGRALEDFPNETRFAR